MIQCHIFTPPAIFPEPPFSKRSDVSGLIRISGKLERGLATALCWTLAAAIDGFVKDVWFVLEALLTLRKAHRCVGGKGSRRLLASICIPGSGRAYHTKPRTVEEFRGLRVFDREAGSARATQVQTSLPPTPSSRYCRRGITGNFPLPQGLVCMKEITAAAQSLGYPTDKGRKMLLSALILGTT